MFQRRPSKFRRRTNSRSHRPRSNGGMSSGLRTNSYSHNSSRNHFRPHQSADKLYEKYNNLAKEALSSGDKTLSENYLQHADHYMRIMEDKNRIQNQNKTQIPDKSLEEGKNFTGNNTAEQESVSQEAKVTEEKLENK